MSQKPVYIFLHASNNEVTTNGIGLQYFKQNVKRAIRNIVLLEDHDHNEGTFDDYTRFTVIRGEKSVEDFLFEQAATTSFKREKWIDYRSQELFHELTAGEIAELLYLAHMDRHWRSPFFYKLQNNYVCLPLDNGGLRMYYRYIDEFFNQVAYILQNNVSDLSDDHRSFFVLKRKADESNAVTLPEVETIKHLVPYFYEGVLILFDKIKRLSNGQIEIPMVLAEDHPHETLSAISTTEAIGSIIYDPKTEKWKIKGNLSQED